MLSPKDYATALRSFISNPFTTIIRPSPTNYYILHPSPCSSQSSGLCRGKNPPPHSMAVAHFSATPQANLRTSLLPSSLHKKNLLFFLTIAPPERQARGTQRRSRRQGSEIRVSNGGDSNLGMWKGSVDLERDALEFQKMVENSSPVFRKDAEDDDSPEALERKSKQFKKILEVPKEERDRAQRMQVIDRAAAALAAAQVLLKEGPPLKKESFSAYSSLSGSDGSNGEVKKSPHGVAQDGNLFVPQSGTSFGTPGPDFWSWTPPQDGNKSSEDVGNSQRERKPVSDSHSINLVVEKEQPVDFLSIPFESTFSEKIHNPPLPPFQSLVEVEKVDVSDSISDLPSLEKEKELQFSTYATEAADALDKVSETSSNGVNLDGSRWWKETGTEQRPDGVVCKWTLTRGVNADGDVEWEEKFWEAADQFDYKELGSEKSGRDRAGNVWREYWRESMWQDLTSGLVNIEKAADKWGKNGKGEEWQEKWWEHFDASGQAEKWSHKWCCIDPNTPLEAGHAHIWHERWGEKFDGQGASMKYTDKWAERSEGDGWTKWGDKWDENFDKNGHGIKQGETWWEGKHGERWNRTWGEHHNGSGWIHKYGKSSSGEQWDTHVEEETWYERHPHYGFEHCFENSVQLREVEKPPETY
ncbi:PREDICTED: uncharacterized protein LOC104613255 isoform X2 [Nelumbo nucifera]|uniref:Uncharacterized protein LOC104613255 isoform X2 n=1 Tax=Nelumbo nucifera TaxID=4432 RepID=A0A1U8BD11_NELNU|nr:PREDICTED: uncharacterized protein LOC104613255 isoform X2 [Nelumbo nucifera]